MYRTLYGLLLALAGALLLAMLSFSAATERPADVRILNLIEPETLDPHLVNGTNTDRIVSLPTFVPVTVQYEIPMEILRFESNDQGVVELSARWAIRSTASGKIVYATESHITETASGTEKKAIVAALSNAVGKLSEEVAAEIQRISSTEGKP